jgi:hypothetical protein
MRELEEKVEVPVGWELPERERGLWSDAFRRLSRNRLAVAALIFIVVLAVLAVAADPRYRRPLRSLQ